MTYLPKPSEARVCLFQNLRLPHSEGKKLIKNAEEEGDELSNHLIATFRFYSFVSLVSIRDELFS